MKYNKYRGRGEGKHHVCAFKKREEEMTPKATKTMNKNVNENQDNNVKSSTNKKNWRTCSTLNCAFFDAIEMELKKKRTTKT